MKISNKNGKIITDIITWGNAFKEVDNSKHWREGYSAYSLAKYFSKPSTEESFGVKVIKDYIDACCFGDVEFTHARIEHESRFDPFRGSGRMQDMVIWAKCGSRHIVICVEAKVNETFGDSLSNAYDESIKYVQKNPKSKKTERIKNLCQEFYNLDVLELSLKSDIRYQLLHYLAGSISEAKAYGDIAFMPIIVFKTDIYDENKGKINKEDYNKFIKSLNFEQYDVEKQIYKQNFNGVDVYISYIEIPMDSE